MPSSLDVSTVPANVDAMANGEQLVKQQQQQHPDSLPPNHTSTSANSQQAQSQAQQPNPNRFIPYHSPLHNPTKGRYITSNDPRGYIPVYEYPLNGQWIMMDMDDGYILWTGIWKALGNHKADIVKMLESQPDLASQLRRVRGGYLKIQGTWLAYEVALRLARRVGWPIRHDLVPLFGPTFPTTCLSPDQPGYGTVIPPTGRRKPRRSLQSVGIPPPHNPPYPSKLPLAKEYVYNVGQVADHSAPHINVPHLTAPGEYYHFRPQAVLSSSPVDTTNSVPFATPSIPTVPALVSVDGPAYSPQEADTSSQYIQSSAAYPPLRERPIKPRYSPYAIPGRIQSPSGSVGSYHIPSPLGYDQPLVHRSSDPNLRGAHTRSHLTLPRLNTQHLLPTKPRSLSAISPGDPEAYDHAGVNGGIRRLKSNDDLTGGSSEDSVRSSIPTTPFNEVASTHFDNGWQLLPPSVDAAHWPDTPGEYTGPYDQASQYLTDSAPSFSDPSSASPRTSWSYDGFSRPSPPQKHLHYNVQRPTHHHYSTSMSSMASYDDRRLSMADSIANAFPEPDMPVPSVAYHRYSQPQIHAPIPPAHLDLWMRERSGSFAEPCTSYGPPHVGTIDVPRTSEEARSRGSGPNQEFVPSPPTAFSPHYLHNSPHASGFEEAGVAHFDPRTAHMEPQAATAW